MIMSGGGILAVVAWYQVSCQCLSSQDALMQECNTVMQAYEEAEEENHRKREAGTANEPDPDGFVTVSYRSVTPS